MIVRKYEELSDSGVSHGNYVEFWIDENKCHVMVSNGEEKQFCELDYNDVVDLRNFLYEVEKAIKPVSEKANG